MNFFVNKTKTTFIILLLAFLGLSFGLPALYNSNGDIRVVFLWKNPDYKNMFSTDKSIIKKITKLDNKTEKYFKKYNAALKQISDTSRKYSKTKLKCLNKRRLKYGTKAYKYAFDRNNLIYKLYLQKIKKSEIDSVLKDRIKFLTDSASYSFKIANTYYDNAKKTNGDKKLELLKQAANESKSAINRLISAIKLIKNGFEKTKNDKKPDENKKNDKKDTINVTKDTMAVSTVNREPVIKHVYDINKDPNILPSDRDRLFALISPTKEELKPVEANFAIAADLDYQIDSIYNEINKLQVMLNTNIANKDSLNNKLQEYYFKLTPMQKRQIMAEINENKAVINIYKKNINKIRPAIDTFSVVNKYILLSDDFARKADSVINVSNDFFISRELSKLNQAKEYLIWAVYYMELAYNTYAPFKEMKKLEYMPQSYFVSFDKTKSKTKTKNKNKTVRTTGVQSVWYYTLKDQRLKPLKDTKGIRFRVELGFFKEMVEPVELPGVTPIVAEKYRGKTFMKYYAGNYKTVEAAQLAKQKAIDAGYKNAKIKAFLNGKPVSYSYAIKKLNKNAQYQTLKNKEIATLNAKDKENQKENKTVVTNSRKTVVKKGFGTDISTVKGSFYFVQIGSFSTLRTYSDFKGVTDLYYYKTPRGLYRYFNGKFATKQEAVNSLAYIKKIYPDAYIVRFTNGKLAATKKTVSNTNKVVYRVQIGAYKSKLNKETIELHNKIRKKYPIFTYKTKSGFTAYTVGNCTNFDCAKKINSDLKKSGLISDGYIVAFKNGKRISLQEAKNN